MKRLPSALSFADQNPWLTAAEKYAVGNIVEGKVARMTDFGAFIELEPGVDALLHVSQISREHVEKPAMFFRLARSLQQKLLISMKKKERSALALKLWRCRPEKKPQRNNLTDIWMQEYTDCMFLPFLI